MTKIQLQNLIDELEFERDNAISRERFVKDDDLASHYVFGQQDGLALALSILRKCKYEMENKKA